MNCNLVLEDLESGIDCTNVMSGIKKILVARRDDVATWPSLIANPTDMAENVTMTGSLAMVAGKRFFSLYSKKDSGELKYDGQGEEGSRSQRATLTVYNPGMKKSLLGFIRATQNSQLVMLVLTESAEWHLLGDRYSGAILSESAATSGKAHTDPNGADLTFIFDTPCAQIIALSDAQIEALCTVNGSVSMAAISDVNESSITSSGATLGATFTNNDETITKVGFRYKKEGTNAWETVSTSSFTSGTAFTKAITGLTTGSDYLYYAFMVVDGQERYSDTFAFTTL